MARKKRGRAAVVVLGDIGRSPRMQYHALSLAEQAGLEVDVIGYAGSSPHKALLENPHIHIHPLVGYAPCVCKKGPRCLYVMLLPFRIIAQVLCLLWLLCVKLKPPDFYLLQNPPTIPTLTCVRFASWLRGAFHIIDWHNFGYSLFALRFGANHPLVRIHKWYELNFGQRAPAHLCVTKAMQQELANNWGIRATVLYDRPPDFFRRCALPETHELFQRITRALNVTEEPVSPCSCTPRGAEDRPSGFPPPKAAAGSVQEGAGAKAGAEGGRELVPVGGGGARLAQQQQEGEEDRRLLEADGSRGGDEAEEGTTGAAAGEASLPLQQTLVTRCVCDPANGTRAAHAVQPGSRLPQREVQRREDRPAIVVSSSSWTADEDFDILLEAGVMYDRRVAALLGEMDDVALLRESGQVDVGSESREDRDGEGGALSVHVGAYGSGGAASSQGQGSRRLSAVSRQSAAGDRYPKLVIIVTGKGPMKKHYEAKMRRLRLRHVAFRTLWLAPEDYPRLLGSADLGVSLHTSSSGLDLPMKVVDMFGCGLPVCAISYSCIHELVRDGQNGLLFTDSSELAGQLIELFRGFPDRSPLLARLRDGAAATGAAGKWKGEWGAKVLPLINKLTGS